MENKEFAEKAEKLISIVSVNSSDDEPTELVKLAREVVQFGHRAYERGYKNGMAYQKKNN